MIDDKLLSTISFSFSVVRKMKALLNYSEVINFYNYVF